MKVFLFTLVVLAAAVRGACVSDPGDLGGPPECRAFDTSLAVKDRMSQAEKVFNVTEPITFELLIANALNAPATLTAGSSCTAVVFEVTDYAQRRQWGSARLWINVSGEELPQRTTWRKCRCFSYWSSRSPITSSRLQPITS